jgi:hypothetical protein
VLKVIIFSHIPATFAFFAGVLVLSVLADTFIREREKIPASSTTVYTKMLEFPMLAVLSSGSFFWHNPSKSSGCRVESKSDSPEGRKKNFEWKK